MRYLTAILFVGYIFQIESAGPECAVPPRERNDCGFVGVTQSKCLEAGCCWAPCRNCGSRVPWCFFSQDMMGDKCKVPSENKVDCGHYGIKQTECVARGCCWRPSKRPNDPWCFNTKTTTTTSTTTTTTEPTTPEYGFEGMVRLVDGDTTEKETHPSDYYASEDGMIAYSGRLEIYHENEWGTVCDDAFNDIDARVVCRQLRWYGGVVMGQAHFGAGDGIIWMDEVSCSGSEPSLSVCDHQGWGSNDCSHDEDVSVLCDIEEPNIGIGQEGDIRLVGGSTPNEGRVEVYHEGEWGTVCDDYFEYNDGQVVCKQLGYTTDEAVSNEVTSFGEGEGRTWMDDVNCAGHETKLIQCSFPGWEVEDCGHGEDVGVRCFGNITNTADGTLRLAPGTGDSEWSGRLEIYHSKQWGTICDDAFEEESAQVACRQLGLSGGRVDSFGRGTDMPIWLDGVYCNGTEERIVDCPNTPWGPGDCTHDEDIGLICDPGNSTATIAPFTVGVVRLLGGERDRGRLQILLNSTWGTVCDDGFNNSAVTVVCSMFGYRSGKIIDVEEFPALDFDVPIWLDNVQCSGDETSIFDCNFETINDCSHIEDVAVQCYESPTVEEEEIDNNIPSE